MRENSFSMDKDGTITLRGYYHIYEKMHDTQLKATNLLGHLESKPWFKGELRDKTIKAIWLKWTE